MNAENRKRKRKQMLLDRLRSEIVSKTTDKCFQIRQSIARKLCIFF
jgi:hypothetical protein